MLTRFTRLPGSTENSSPWVPTRCGLRLKTRQWAITIDAEAAIAPAESA